MIDPEIMNLGSVADHKICGSSQSGSAPVSDGISVTRRRSEGGYTLVALLAMMTVVALFAMAVAPSARQQSQRELEKEAIFRGEQVADAIRAYYRYRSPTTRGGDQALPTSMDQLLQGIPISGGAKNRMILRPSAARDPLTIEGEWRFILPRTDALIDFQQSVMFYAGNILPTSTDTQMAQLQQLAVPLVVPSITNLGVASPTRGTSSIADDATGPFVGVASRSRRDSVLTYYGLERHEQWIFTPLFR